MICLPPVRAPYVLRFTLSGNKRKLFIGCHCALFFIRSCSNEIPLLRSRSTAVCLPQYMFIHETRSRASSFRRYHHSGHLPYQSPDPPFDANERHTKRGVYCTEIAHKYVDFNFLPNRPRLGLAPDRFAASEGRWFDTCAVRAVHLLCMCVCVGGWWQDEKRRGNFPKRIQENAVILYIWLGFTLICIDWRLRCGIVVDDLNVTPRDGHSVIDWREGNVIRQSVSWVHWTVCLGLFRWQENHKHQWAHLRNGVSFQLLICSTSKCSTIKYFSGALFLENRKNCFYFWRCTIFPL